MKTLTILEEVKKYIEFYECLSYEIIEGEDRIQVFIGDFELNALSNGFIHLEKEGKRVNINFVRIKYAIRYMVKYTEGLNV